MIIVHLADNLYKRCENNSKVRNHTTFCLEGYRLKKVILLINLKHNAETPCHIIIALLNNTFNANIPSCCTVLRCMLVIMVSLDIVL